MRRLRYKTRHETMSVKGLDIFFRHAGEPDAPGILLLHGFPSSSHMYRDIMEPLAETAYVVAPDLPGFGFSSAPSADQYDYTFENLADTIEEFVAAIGLERFFLFVSDFGTPVGYHLATRHPHRIRGLVVQNGNAHDEGLGPQWDAPKAFWANPTDENRAKLPEWLNFEGTRDPIFHVEEMNSPRLMLHGDLEFGVTGLAGARRMYDVLVHAGPETRPGSLLGRRPCRTLGVGDP